MKALLQSLNRVAIEEIRTVNKLARQAFGQIPKICLKIQTRRVAVNSCRVNNEVSQGLRLRNILQRECHLEQWIVTQAPFWLQLLNQFFKWQILMTIGRKRGLLYLAKQLAKSQIGCDLRPPHV